MQQPDQGLAPGRTDGSHLSHERPRDNGDLSVYRNSSPVRSKEHVLDKGMRHNIHEKSELVHCCRVSKRDVPWTVRKSVRKNPSTAHVPGHTWQKQTLSGPHTRTPDFVRDVNRTCKSVRQSLACINVNRRNVVKAYLFNAKSLFNFSYILFTQHKIRILLCYIRENATFYACLKNVTWVTSIFLWYSICVQFINF